MPGLRSIAGREGSEWATRAARPSWERIPVAAPRVTLLNDGFTVWLPSRVSPPSQVCRAGGPAEQVADMKI